MTSLIDIANKLSREIKDKEALWTAQGWTAIDVCRDLYDNLSWHRHNKRHRIIYMGRPLIECQLSDRFTGWAGIQELESLLESKAKELIATFSEESSL